nr:hypothetical protein Iba_chr04aCG13350 [Ipomoea batatas]
MEEPRRRSEAPCARKPQTALLPTLGNSSSRWWLWPMVWNRWLPAVYDEDNGRDGTDSSRLNIVPPEHMFIQGWKSGTYVLDQVDRFSKQIYDVMMPFYS